jgi:hypothetical protein
LGRKSGLCLLDPHENSGLTENLSQTIFYHKKFLIAMSPERKNCAKDARFAAPIYMGPTTLEESESMRKCCYDKEVTSEQLQQRFARGGGIPRSLFKSAGESSLFSGIDVALADIEERQAFAL